MKEQIQLSIIIPVYNAEAFIEECLDSVLQQKYEPLEIICINDGSTDKSADIIQKFCAKDPRIKYKYKPHTNAADARNMGLEIATGDYILFIDSDDFLADGALGKLIAKAEQTQADIIISQYKLFDNKTGRTYKQPYGIHTKKKLPFKITDIPVRQFEFTNIAVWNKLYKAMFIKSQNLQFKSYVCLNDIFFSLVAIATANSIALCHNTTIYYRINVKGSISSNTDYINDNFLIILTETNERLQKLPYWDTIKHSLLNMEQSQLLEFCQRLPDANKANMFKHAAMQFISSYRF